MGCALIKVNTEVIEYEYTTSCVKENVNLLMKLKEHLDRELDRQWELMINLYGEPGETQPLPLECCPV